MSVRRLIFWFVPTVLLGSIPLFSLDVSIPSAFRIPVVSLVFLLLSLLAVRFRRSNTLLAALVVLILFFAPLAPTSLWFLQRLSLLLYAPLLLVLSLLSDRPVGRQFVIRLLVLVSVLYLFLFPFRFVAMRYETALYALFSAIPMPVAMMSFVVVLPLFLPIVLWKRDSAYPLFFTAAMTAFITGYYADNIVYAAIPLLLLGYGIVDAVYRMAYHDELTALPGRRALRETLSSSGRKYAIAMLDIDHFKKFNDSYGHDAGDRVLRKVASHIAAVGGGGKPFRYGGEEFTIFFSGKTAEEALPHCEKVREQIAGSPFVIRSKKGRKHPGKKGRGRGAKAAKQVPVTISIGVADSRKYGNDSSVVIKKADEHLYKAKKTGRNKVVA